MSAEPLAGGVPAAWLRVAVAGAAAGIVVDLTLAGNRLALVIAAAGIGAACVLWPGSPAALGLIVVAALGIVPGADPFDAGVLVLVPLVHLLHLSCAHAALVPPTGRVHPAALRPALVRAAAVQGVAFLLVGIAAAVPSGPDDALIGGLAVAACVAIVLILLRLTRRT